MSLIPLYWRRKLEIFLYNLRQRRVQNKVSAVRRNGFVQLCVGPDCVALASIGRWKKYRQGIGGQLENVAARYGFVGIENEAELSRAVVLDIGANIGEFSLYCAHLGCSVYAIEPDPVNMRALIENTKNTSIQAVQAALWDKKKDITFYSSVARADSSLIPPESVEDSYLVQAVPLDQFIEERQIGEIFFMKADAEGAEPEVLKGAESALKRTRFISLDCGPERMGESTVSECAQILRESGFSVKSFGSNGNMLFGVNAELTDIAD